MSHRHRPLRNRDNGGSGRNRTAIEISDEESEERVDPPTGGQSEPAVSGWARLVRHLRRVRSRQRLFGYLGQVLQWYPPTLRDRPRRVDPTASQSRH